MDEKRADVVDQCQSCQVLHTRIAVLERELERLADVVCDQDCEIITALLEGHDNDTTK